MDCRLNTKQEGKFKSELEISQLVRQSRNVGLGLDRVSSDSALVLQSCIFYPKEHIMSQNCIW